MNTSQAIKEIDASIQRHREETLAILSQFENKNATAVNVERLVTFVGEIRSLHISGDGIADFFVDTLDEGQDGVMEDETLFSTFSYRTDEYGVVTSVNVERVWNHFGGIRLDQASKEELGCAIADWIEDHE